MLPALIRTCLRGSPHQNPASFEQTLADVILMCADRISLFGYAHLPARFAAQRKILSAWLPDGPLRLALAKRAQPRLTEAGYCQIGMDHFVLTDDPLAVAQQLHRKFKGYTTGEKLTEIGFGVSASSATV